MHRAQLILEDWQYEGLKSLSERQGKSVSGLVREVLAAYLRPAKGRAASRLRRMEGIGSDPRASGRDHDRFLYPPPRRH